MLDKKNQDVLEALRQSMEDNPQSIKPDDERKPRIETDKNQISHFPEIGDIVEYGNWPFTESGEIHPVEWLVLQSNKQDDTLLLITNYCIERQPCELALKEYEGAIAWHTDSQKGSTKTPYSYQWSKSYLLSWLKEQFYEKCFNDEEKENLLNLYDDKKTKNNLTVGILSAAQVLSLMPSLVDRRAKPTPYCEKGKPMHDSIPWWLSDSTEFYTDAAAVFSDGSVCVDLSDEYRWINDMQINHNRPACHGLDVYSRIGVRPVIKLKCENITNLRLNR